MSTKAVLDSALTLSPTERLELLGQIWDSLASEPDALALSDADRAELDRRVRDMEDNPGDESSWEEVEARLRSRR